VGAPQSTSCAASLDSGVTKLGEPEPGRRTHSPQMPTRTERERERETERDRENDRETETERETHTHTQRQ
jgi:hypothetical protein